MSEPNRIDAMFAAKREAGRRAMIFYLTAGFPDVATCEAAVDALDEAGADLIELGIPFSDPIADGPTIQASSQAALEAGMTVQGALDLARSIRARSPIALLFFSAYNPIARYGLDRFTSEAADAGADGLLIPDLPPEEGVELERLCAARGLKLVYLAAPTSDEARRRLIARHSTGFIYYISLRGVTGAREKMAADLREQIAALREVTELPIAVGFGISKPEHARAVGAEADGVVVGSELIKRIERHASSPDFKEQIAAFARGLIEALPAGGTQVGSR